MPDPAVEAAAKAAWAATFPYELDQAEIDLGWKAMPEFIRERWRHRARRILSAAGIGNIVATADALRKRLDALNEAGLDHKLAGVDSRGNVFLACLDGAYAEHIAVIFGNPWDCEVGPPRGYRCDECSGHEPGTVEDLTFPARVIYRPEGDDR